MNQDGDQAPGFPGSSTCALDAAYWPKNCMATDHSGTTRRLPLTAIDRSICISVHFRLVFCRMRLVWLMFAYFHWQLGKDL